MNEDFNHQMSGVSPEQTRAALSERAQEKTMVEREQLVPELKPHGLGEDVVDRQHYMARLHQEQMRMSNHQAHVTEIHTNVRVNGQLVASHSERQVMPIDHTRKTTNEFNMHAAQAHDAKELGLSY